MTPRVSPVATAQMLIRKPAAEVFEAFVDPSLTSRFWFTRGSGRVAKGKQLRWEWEMYGVSVPVDVKEVETNRRILIEWGDPPSPVEWNFAPRADNTTLVSITCRDFHGDESEIVAKAIDAMGGFTLVLAGLKALLEHNVNLNLVADRHPDGHVRTGR